MSQELKQCESCGALKHQQYPQRSGDVICAACGATYGLSANPVPPAGGEVEVLGLTLAVLREAFNTPNSAARITNMDVPAITRRSIEEFQQVRAHVTRLQAENAALQQRLNVADQRVDELNTALETCGRWFAKHSPTAPLIGGFGEAEHPMITFIRGAQSVPAAKVDCGNCAFVDGVCSTGCETQRIRAAQQ